MSKCKVRKMKNPTQLDWEAMKQTLATQTASGEKGAMHAAWMADGHPELDNSEFKRLREKWLRQRVSEMIERYTLKHKVDYRAVLEQFLLLQTTDQLLANWKEVSTLWFADS